MSERRVRKTEVARSFDRLPLNALARIRGGRRPPELRRPPPTALHVTPAAVSMQIRTLEDYLRVPLSGAAAARSL